MPLFGKSREKVHVEGFCRSWYDNYVFQPVAGHDVRRDWTSGIHSECAKRGMPTVDQNVFHWMLTAMQMELFGTALAHRTRGNERLVLAEATTTKTYLANRQLRDLWDVMSVFNKAVAANSVMLRGKASSVMINHMRMSLFDKYVKQGIDPECAARAANRTGTDVDFENSGPTRLAVTFFELVEVDPNEETIFPVAAAGFGFYRGARESLEAVELTP